MMDDNKSDEIIVHGATIDNQTRCKHYHSPLDVVAICFACCKKYYPCYQCHAERADHPAEVWPQSAFETRAILCGVCHNKLTINEYLETDECPHCGAHFNPGCKTHAHFYFEKW